MNKIVVLKLVHMETLAAALILLAIFFSLNFIEKVRQNRYAETTLFFSFWIGILLLAIWLLNQFGVDGK